MSRRALLPFALALAACQGDRVSSSDPAGLATVFDSTGDTVRANVVGTVAAERIRQLETELEIASERGDSIVFGRAGEFVVAPNGRVMLYDPTGPQLLMFAPDGSLQARVGRAGGGPGEYRDLNGLVALGDSLFAFYDAGAARVSFFRHDGTYASSWTLPAMGFLGGAMLSTDRTGVIRLAQYVIPPNGDFMSAQAATAQIVDGGGRLADTVVAPTLGVRQPEYRAEATRDGNRASTMTVSQLSPGEVAEWHPDGHFVVMGGGESRILFATRDGPPVLVTRAAPSIPVDPDERAWHEERTLWIMRRTDPSWTWHGPPIPSERAAASGMFVARDGNVWVQVALPSEPIPEAERTPPRPGALSPARWRARSDYEVFAPTGRFLGRVTVPERTTLSLADGNTVWGIRADEDGVQPLVKLRVIPAFGDPAS